MSLSSLDPAASSVLESGWVQITNIPPRALNVEAVTLIAELAGEVVVVDELSLIKEGPVRVKLRVRELQSIRGIIEIFFEGVGYDIKFMPERKKEEAQSRKPPPPPPTNRRKRGDDTEDEEEEEPGWRRNRNEGQENVNSQKFSSQGQGHQASGAKQCKDLVCRQSGSGPEEGERSESVGKHRVTDALPLAIYDPATDQRVILGQTGANNPASDKFPTPPANHRLVHTEGGGYRFLEVSKWPKLLIPDEIAANSPKSKSGEDLRMDFSQESMGVDDMDLPGGGDTGEQIEEGEAIGNSELEHNEQEEWEMAGVPKQKTVKRKFYPAVATRKSARSSPSTFKPIHKENPAVEGFTEAC
ncbi:unnamed protein product [Urochloa humidicola]